MSMYPSLPCIRVVEANAGIIDLVDDDNDVFIPSFNAEEVKNYKVKENFVLELLVQNAYAHATPKDSRGVKRVKAMMNSLPKHAP